MSVQIFSYTVEVWELLSVLAVLLCALEIFAPGFILLPIGLAFGLTALMATLVSSWLWVWVLLGLNLFVMIWFFQAVVSKIWTAKSHQAVATNMDNVLGKDLVVTKKIEGSKAGEVKLYGDRWVAYSQSGKTYEKEESVKAVSVDGNKLILP